MRQLAFLYILALVSANLAVWAIGPWASPFIGFLLIGLDLSLRDRLHDKVGPFVATALVLLASVASWLVNPAAGQIAVASFAAFAMAGLADTAAYQALRSRPQLVRMNGSNVAGALVDSLVFPTIAFGGLMPEIVALQFGMKLAGGALWAWLLTRRA